MCGMVVCVVVLREGCWLCGCVAVWLWWLCSCVACGSGSVVVVYVVWLYVVLCCVGCGVCGCGCGSVVVWGELLVFG